jgi:hypothetical protein
MRVVAVQLSKVTLRGGSRKVFRLPTVNVGSKYDPPPLIRISSTPLGRKFEGLALSNRRMTRLNVFGGNGLERETYLFRCFPKYPTV